MDTFYSSLRSRSRPNVSAAAQRGSHITAPVLTNNTITGDVHFLHNAHGFTLDRPHSETAQTSATRSLIFKHKTRICTEYQYVTEYNSLPGEHVLLSERYTQPLILQRHRDQKEREEELRSSGEDFQQVLNSRSSHESVHLNSLFNPDNHGISPSAVILQGNSGNGKSLTVQKIMMDWTSNKLYKERFDIVFHLKCKEINRIPGRKSLVEILSYSCSLTPDQISQILQQSPEKMLFIIDGFDELRLTEDTYYMSPHTDVIQKAPAEVTLCALLRGHILPESFLLVTTRSTATDTLSNLLKGPQRFTEIMGFSEKGVEEYFQKFFQDEELFRRAYTFVKTNENLFTTCSIPVICWIICTAIKERFRVGADVTSGLETTTSIYVDFVSTLLKHHCQGLSQSVPTLLRSLGQLAERGMLEQQVLLDENTVYETISDPSANPFLCKFLFKRRICQETMFSFMHLSFQEFFTALYCVILDEEESKRKLSQLISDNESLECPSRFAAVVQFVFGLLNKDVRHTLRKTLGLFVHPNTQALLKKWILKELQKHIYHRKTLFILHCLYELHEEDFVIKAMKSWNRINAYGAFIRRTDCWALLYCSQCCQCIEELDLLECRGLTSEKLMMILPGLPKFKKLFLPLEDPSVTDFVELMCALTRGQTLNSQEVWVTSYNGICSVRRTDLLISEELSRIVINPLWHDDPARSLKSLSLTLPCSELSNINWTKLFQIIYHNYSDALMLIPCSYSKLKKMEIRVDCLTKRWCVWTLQIIQNCPSLTEVKVDAYFLLEEGIKILQRSRTRPACVMRVDGFVLVYHHTFCISKFTCISFLCSLIETRAFKLQNTKTP